MSTKTKFNLVSIGLMAGLVAAFCNPLWVVPAGATDTLDSHGFTNIETTGYSWFGCGRGDLWHTKFTATNQNGKEVSGVVCKGLLKGSTMRLD